MKHSSILRALAASLNLPTTSGKTPEPFLIMGPPGIGKSSAPVDLAKLLGCEIIVFPSAPTLDAVDIRGIPRVVTPSDCEDFGLSPNLIGSTVAFPPDFFPKKVNGPTIIVIDDVTAANPAVQAALLQPVLDRKLGAYKVPHEVMFVLTGNRVEDKAGSSRTITALDSRVIRIDMEVSLDDWIGWATKNEISDEIIAFHRHYTGTYLWKFNPKDKCNPLPRTWEKADTMFKVMAGDEEFPEVLAGLVGNEAATMFVGFHSIVKDLISPKVVFANPKQAPLPKTNESMLVTVSSLARAVRKDTFEAFLIYLARFPQPEYAAMAIQDAVEIAPSLKESPGYVKHITNNLNKI